ncbi:Predicted arabinose efflux permease, MFS family [Saccharopolyspora antimicrobica]|uniref:MFS family arabinose efflux permease n=1 Tax=Saccharopolyspora antimicrobica TaxID=455193 RepID=A0A1I4U7M4_9PSEU|nr:MFS transporter [Saccharopolyspora antimicrobica]RKT88722.1 putative MFS family arabinose efflux permease [Saccharopolyspora antimicrobica]SFM84962.1 Predicted arabinose efflux permease, MFS family [Saccharopolyspora antimicrobica]
MIRRVWPLVAAAIALGIDAYVLAGVLPSIADSLATTAAAVGLGVTAFTAAYALAGPLLSGMLTRGGTAGALLIALGVFNLGNLITVVAPGIEVFLASRVVAGAGAGVLTAVATATAAAMVADHERGRAMAMVTFGLSTGTVAGVPVGMIIGDRLNWRWTMGLVVAVGVLSMIALAVRARAIPALPASRGPAFGVLRSSRTVVGILAAFLLGVASLGLYTYLLPMAEARGLQDWGFALVWAWGIGGVAGAALIGRPLDAFGPRALLVALPAVLLAGFAAIWVFASPVVWLAAAALWGAAGWSSVPTLQQALTRDRPERAMPVVAFQMAAMYLGSAAGAAAGSSLLAAGTDPGDLAGWTLVPAALGLLLTGWLSAGSPRLRVERRSNEPACEAAA